MPELPAQSLPTGRRDQAADLIRLAASLRRRGHGSAVLRSILQERFSAYPQPAVDPAVLHTIVAAIATVPPSEVAHAVEELLQSAPPRPLARPPVHTAASIAARVPATVDWLAEPWIAAGALTAITGRPKIGKTTFVLDLLHALLAGGPFLGYPTSPAPVLYLTEQPPASFRASLARSNLLDCHTLAVLFWHEAAALQWPAVVAQAGDECRARAARVLIIDTLSQWAGLRGDMENQAGDAFQALQPLQQLTGEGIAVLFLQHERKSGGDAADAGRGSSAFAGAVDTLVSFRHPPSLTARASIADPDVATGVRLLLGLSRFESVPRELYVERRSGAYTALGQTAAYAIQQARAAVLAALPPTEAASLTVDDLCATTGAARPAILRALHALLAERHIQRTGSGHRAHPHRYWRAAGPDPAK